MAAWRLSDNEWDAVDRLPVGTGDAPVFRNATIILMSRSGASEAFLIAAIDLVAAWGRSISFASATAKTVWTV